MGGAFPGFAQVLNLYAGALTTNAVHSWASSVGLAFPFHFSGVSLGMRIQKLVHRATPLMSAGESALHVQVLYVCIAMHTDMAQGEHLQLKE